MCTSILGTRLTSKGHSGFCLSWDQRSGGVYGLLLLLLRLWDSAFALAFCPFLILVLIVSQVFTFPFSLKMPRVLLVLGMPFLEMANCMLCSVSHLL